MSADSPSGGGETGESIEPSPAEVPSAADSAYGSGGSDDPTMTAYEAWEADEAADTNPGGYGDGFSSDSVPGSVDAGEYTRPPGTFSADSDYGSGGSDDPTMTAYEAWEADEAADAAPDGSGAGYDGGYGADGPAAGSGDQGYGGLDGGDAGAPDGAGEGGPSGSRQRSDGESQERSADPAPAREEGDGSQPEAGESGDQQAEAAERASEAVRPVPQPDLGEAGQPALDGDQSPAADASPPPDASPEARESASPAALPDEAEPLAETGSGPDDAADEALLAARSDSAPVTHTDASDDGVPGDQDSPALGRPEDADASLVAPEASGIPPETAESEADADAQRETPLVPAEAEPAPGDTESGETTAAPEAEAVQISTAEHDPQTSDPEPEPETEDEAAAALDGDNAPDVSDSGGDGGDSGTTPPDAPEAGKEREPGEKVLYWKGEFHGETLELYSDLEGREWASGAAVDALKKEQEEEGESRGLPRDRDLGDNEAGENPDVHLGDTGDTRTFGEKMTGEGGSFGEAVRKQGESKEASDSILGSLLDEAVEGGDDLHDGASDNSQAVGNFFLHGAGPTNVDLPLHPPGPAYVPSPVQGVNTGEAVGSTLIMAAAAMTGIRHLIDSHRKDHEQ